MRLAAANSQLNEFPLDVTDSLPTVDALAERYAALATSTRRAIEAANDQGDAATEDLFTEVSRGLDKALWFLEAHLQKSGKYWDGATTVSHLADAFGAALFTIRGVRVVDVALTPYDLKSWSLY